MQQVVEDVKRVHQTVDRPEHQVNNLKGGEEAASQLHIDVGGEHIVALDPPRADQRVVGEDGDKQGLGAGHKLLRNVPRAVVEVPQARVCMLCPTLCPETYPRLPDRLRRRRLRPSAIKRKKT